MNFSEALSVSGARKIVGFGVHRDIYSQEGPIENYHTFFEDIEAADSFPIVLVGDWKDDEYILNFIEKKVRQFINKVGNITFIIKEDNGSFGIMVFEKNTPADIPLWNLEPTHSTHTLYWKEVMRTQITIQSFSEQLGVNGNFLKAIEDRK